MEELHSWSIGDLILYKNNQLIALNKPNGIPVQEDLTEDKALVNLASIYAKSNIFVTHRIDRPASGIVLFAKNKKALAALNKQIQERKLQKTYLAVVKNAPENSSGELIHHLKKNGKTNKSIALDEPQKNTKKAILTYETLGQIDNYTLLKIDLHTGRHHQIRAQLAAIDCPIKGDVKYGFRRGNRDKSIELHAWKLGFTHPVSHEMVHLVAPPPKTTIWEAFAAAGVDFSS